MREIDANVYDHAICRVIVSVQNYYNGAGNKYVA